MLDTWMFHFTFQGDLNATTIDAFLQFGNVMVMMTVEMVVMKVLLFVHPVLVQPIISSVIIRGNYSLFCCYGVKFNHSHTWYLYVVLKGNCIVKLTLVMSSRKLVCLA